MVRGIPGLLARRRPVTLAGQFLLLQLAVLLVVLAVTSLVSLRQSDQDFRDTRGARLRAAAENLASTTAVQDGMEVPAERIPLAFYAQQRADDVGATAVYLTDTDGRVFVGTDPTRQGELVDLGPRTVLEGRSWTGDVTDRGRTAIAAEVPIYSNDEGEAPEVVGVAVVTEVFPPLAERLRNTVADFALYLLVGLSLGLLGSLLLSRLIRRRTRGLEPAQIASLADEREALLTSIREGLVAVDPHGVVTVVSESARELLGLPEHATGRGVADLDLPAGVADLLAGTDEVHDAIVVVGDRVLVVNRTRVRRADRSQTAAGTVTTLRDRTELVALQSELDARESITDTLRAQTHEFSNQLHTISGLVQLEEYDEVSRLVGTLARRRAEISDHITSRLDDPAVAALLIAKASLAAERRTELVLDDDSRLPRLDPDLSADVGTVLGNLVDNALDAADARVAVRVEHADGTVVLRVSDDGPGVPEGTDVFRRGYTTKPTDALGRGVGLALVQVVCERRGGNVSVLSSTHDDGEAGAVFIAVLPGRVGVR